MNMNEIKIGGSGLQSERVKRTVAGKNGARDADILVLLWDVFKTRANEIDQLLDLSLSILSSTIDFSQKAELEDALKRALSLVRT